MYVLSKIYFTGRQRNVSHLTDGMFSLCSDTFTPSTQLMMIYLSFSYSFRLHIVIDHTLLYQPYGYMVWLCIFLGSAYHSCITQSQYFRLIILACHGLGRLGLELLLKWAELYLKCECYCDVYEWVLSELTHKVLNKVGNWVNSFHPMPLPYLHFNRHFLATSCRLLGSTQVLPSPLLHTHLSERYFFCAQTWKKALSGIQCHYILIQFQLHSNLVIKIST